MPTQSKNRLLLIDDDKSLGQLLQEYLEIEGFRLDLAPNGATGITVKRSAHAEAV